MANVNISTNMNLPVPQTGVEPGPQYATDINSCMTIIDQHNHSSGSGVQITPNGLNINADLTINSNNLTLARSARFNPQVAPLALISDIGCLYVAGLDLYYNDVNGTQVRITQSGGIAGTPGSIANLTAPAAAAYVSGSSTFVWQSNTNTAANMDAGSLIIRELVANANAVTLASATSLASNYTLTLPTIPVNNSFLSLATDGTIGTISQTGGIVGTSLAANTVTQDKLYIRSVGSVTATAGNVALSTGSDNYTSNSTTLTLVPGLSVTLATTGRPVMLSLISEPFVFYSSSVGFTGGSGANVLLYRNGTRINITNVSTGVHPILNFLDVPSAGSTSYDIYIQCSTSATTLTLNGIQLMAYEI
jgi:hypothetical protein